MNNCFKKDIFVDTNVMRLYDKPKDKVFLDLFKWIRTEGVLTINQKLVIEYSQFDNRLIMILLNELNRKGRLNLVSKSQLCKFKADHHFNYKCNQDDIIHARTVFLSYRKRCISFDKNFREDINSFKKINKIKPCACRAPRDCCIR